MYPFSHSLSFTDHLYIPSFIAYLISFFSSNPILQFNLLWILNHIAVFLTFYLFAGRFAKNVWSRIISAFYISFGPYFFLQFGHLQMVFLWPLFLSLYYLFDPHNNKKSLVLSGVFLGIQFLSSIYLGLIGMTIIGLYFVEKVVVFLAVRPLGYERRNGKDRILDPGSESGMTGIIKEFGIVFISFLFVSSVSIYGYILVQVVYHPQRFQGEFVTFAAHISDYLFPLPVRSTVLYRLFSFWTNLNKHVLGEQASFVGIVPFGIIIYVILNLFTLELEFHVFQNLKTKKIKINNNVKRIPNPLQGKQVRDDNRSDRNDRSLFIWISLLLFTGLVFSLGPRFNWNGQYLVTPLPYWFIMKIFPPITIMRATARWYFLVALAVSVTMVFGIDLILKRFKKHAYIVIGVIISLVVLEFYPSPVEVAARNWKANSYLFLQKQCQIKPGPLLEYPIEYRADDFDYVKNLQYKTNILMSSTLHTCPFLSGFSSYEPPLFLKWKEQFDKNGLDRRTMEILNEQKFKYVKINVKALSNKERLDSSLYIHTEQLNEIYRDADTVIYLVRSVVDSR